MTSVNELLKKKLTTESYNRLIALDNPKMHEFVADAIELCSPVSVLSAAIRLRTELIFVNWQ